MQFDRSPIAAPPTTVRRFQPGWALAGLLLLIALFAWARATAGLVHIPAVDLPLPGILAAVIGMMLLFPGANRLLPYPIHTGVCLICAGVSIANGSGSGLWLVTPVVIAGSVALGAGIKPRNPNVRLLPEDRASAPTGRDYAKFFLFMVLPWLVMYEAVLAIGIPPDAINGVSPFEKRLPVLEWTQIFYGSVYLFVLSMPFFAKTKGDLRWFSVRGLWTMMVAYPAFLAIPLIAPKRHFIADSLPGHLLLWEQSMDSPVAAFPSFHVIWVLLAAEVYSRRWPRLKWLFYGWAILVAISCVTTSQHSILDVIGGVVTVAFVAHAPQLWQMLRRRAIHTAARPALPGMLLVALAAPLFGTNVWLYLAAFAVSVSWLGIVVRLVARSRHLCDISPYSVYATGLIAVTVTRLWLLAVPLHLITGLYLILDGLARYAERKRFPESAQWITIATVQAGALITAIGQSSAAPAWGAIHETTLRAVLFGVAAAIATEVNFPRAVIWRNA